MDLLAHNVNKPFQRPIITTYNGCDPIKLSHFETFSNSARIADQGSQNRQPGCFFSLISRNCSF